MTMHRMRRCANCGTVYSFQSSGFGAPKYNNGTYCVDCWEAVCVVLKTIPRKFERKYVNVQQNKKFEHVTLELLLKAEKDKIELDIKNNVPKPIFTKVFAPLFDLVNNDKSTTREITMDVDYKPIVFLLTTWDKRPDYEITVDMEWDCENKKLTGNVWKDYQ